MTAFTNMRGRMVCALALASFAAAPATATEPARECRTVAALTSGKAGDLAKVSLHFGRDGTIDLRTSGRADSLTGANECEISGPVDQIEVDCEWNFESEAEARTALGQMRDRIVSCTPLGFTRTENRYATENYIVHLTEKAEFELDDYDAIDLQLDMIESIFAGVSRFRVTLVVDR